MPSKNRAYGFDSFRKFSFGISQHICAIKVNVCNNGIKLYKNLTTGNVVKKNMIFVFTSKKDIKQGLEINFRRCSFQINYNEKENFNSHYFYGIINVSKTVDLIEVYAI